MLKISSQLIGCAVGAFCLGFGVANATTVTEVALSSDMSLSGSNNTNPLFVTAFSGAALGTAPSTSTTWVAFTVSPSAPGDITVDNLGLNFPSEQFAVVTNPTNTLGTLTGGTSVVALTSADNLPHAGSFTSGVTYFLELFSGPPTTPGLSSGEIKISIGGITTPLPGALVLFGTVLAGAGAFMRRRRDGSTAALTA